MLQGPCGDVNPNCPCMNNQKKECSKFYPKAFVEETIEDFNGYPLYRRRDDGKTYVKDSIYYNNRDVVPFNAYLSLKYNAHICVEICTNVRCVKYLYKYVYKGHD